MRLVAFPIGALVVVVGAEERMKALWRMQHIVVCSPRPLIILVILPWRIQLRQLCVQFVVGLSRRRNWCSVGGVERKRRRAFEGGAHDRDGPENVGPHERGP